MEKSKFSDAHIVAILQEGAAGVPIVELLRTHGISRPTFDLWRQKYGGAGVL
jgi:putative transposase